MRMAVVSILLLLTAGCDNNSGGPGGATGKAAVGGSADASSVGQLLPSETAHAQAATVTALRQAGWRVETNGLEEAVIAILEDGEIGSENGRRLSGLKTLEQVRLWNCPDADDAFVERVAGLAKLRVLVIRGGRLTDACFETLLAAEALESLNLGNMSGLTGRGVAGLLARGRIKRLYLDHTSVSEEVIEAWPVENSLQMLNLNHTHLGTAAARTLQEFPTLKSVFVVQAGLATDAVAAWRRARPNCLVYDGRERPGGSPERPAVESP